MPNLIVACPGDRLSGEAHTVFLLDDRFYPAAFFAAHFNGIDPGPGVEICTEKNETGFRLTREGNARLAEIAKQPARVMFFTASDTHVKTFAPIADQCDQASYVVRFTEDHSAKAFLEKTGKTWVTHARKMAAWNECNVAITGNDWGNEDRLFVAHAREHNIPSVCLQESIIDFDDYMRRMCWADYAFIQGPYTFRYLKRSYSFLAGNPRYDSIKPLPLPPAPKAFINCNFTFGIFEEQGPAWVKDVTTSAQSLGLDYTVSLHPRCYIDLSGIENVVPSNAFVVHDQIASSTIIVTRFSSLAHEALLMGRHVIYYNPHGEKMRYLNEDATGLLAKAFTREELVQCLRTAMTTPPPASDQSRSQNAFQNLFCSTDGLNHQRCATALRAVAAYAKDYPPHDIPKESVYALRNRVFMQDWLRPRLSKLPLAKKLWRSAKKIVKRT